jgi:hypothetical protein
VEHTLNQNEHALSQLKAERAMLLSKQQELKQEKQRVEKQRVQEQRQLLEAKARRIAAWNQHKANVPAAEEGRHPQSIRLIQGMDGRMYHVLAPVDESSDDANDHKVDGARECSSANEATSPMDIFELMQAGFLEAGKELEDKEAKQTEENVGSTIKKPTRE